MVDTFGTRMGTLRRLLGSRGEATSTRGWALDMGVTQMRGRAWEKLGCHPRHGVVELTEALGRVPSVKARGLDPRLLAGWALTGIGPMPIGAPAGPDDPGGMSRLPRTVGAMDGAVVQPRTGSSEGKIIRLVDALEVASDPEAQRGLLRDIKSSLLELKSKIAQLPNVSGVSADLSYLLKKSQRRPNSRPSAATSA